jgi:glycerophosphoryl diester phosphodiesterase
VQQRLPSLLDEPIAFGHRGARAYAADNTLESFELALTLGANGLESDVWLTADGVAVLDHDGIVPRRFGRTAAIASIDRQHLPPHIPSLDDLLQRVGTALHLSLDLKDPAAGQVVIDTVARCDAGLLDRTWLCAPAPP